METLFIRFVRRLIKEAHIYPGNAHTTHLIRFDEIWLSQYITTHMVNIGTAGDGFVPSAGPELLVKWRYMIDTNIQS